MAETIEESNFTSVQRRIEAKQQADREANAPATQRSSNRRRDAFLAKLSINALTDAVGPNPSSSPNRCSDKGVLEMDVRTYIELLDWSARQSIAGKRGSTPTGIQPVLKRLGLDQKHWFELLNCFEDVLYHLAGRCDRIDRSRSHLTHRRFRVRPPASQPASQVVAAFAELSNSRHE